MNTIASTTLVIAAFLVVISAVQPVAARLHVPFTVLLACVGVLVGGVSTFVVDHARLEPVLEIAGPLADLPISAPVFLTVFLPLLLFHAALTIDLREIARDIGPILTLAILAVFAAAAAIGFGLSLAGVPLAVGLLLGAIVATTDPAAVIAIFRELGAPPRLTRLLEGESLLNDAAAIVLFGILVEMLAGGAQSSVSDAALDFAATFVGGLVFGAVAGRLFGAALPWLGSSRTAEVTLSVALPYIVYIVGEHALARVRRRRGRQRRADGRDDRPGSRPAGKLAVHRAGLGAARFLGKFADLRHGRRAGAAAARGGRASPCLAAADRGGRGAAVARRRAVRHHAAAQRAAAQPEGGRRLQACDHLGRACAARSRWLWRWR